MRQLVMADVGGLEKSFIRQNPSSTNDEAKLLYKKEITTMCHRSMKNEKNISKKTHLYA